MTTVIAYANIQQPFPFSEIPLELVPEKLLASPAPNRQIQQRHQCRRLAHFLLWHLLKITGKNTALLGKIKRTQSGRPYFPHENLDFNISHSGDWVTVILDCQNEKKSAVGIDIEFPKTRNFLALMQHFAPQDEVEWFSQSPHSEQAFYRAWCLREAILKSQGVGIAKLSEVQHFPTEHKITSSHCPQGELLFSATLPFYFAAFINQRQNQPHFFQWNGEKLEKKAQQDFILYEVN